MLKIKKQIRSLLTISALNAFQIAGASWVALLAVRGFSMVQIGLAESCFHVASLLFEIPSGVISDVFGRKRSMLLSQCMLVLSSLVMAFSNSLPDVCGALMLLALSYNFASGAREALAYDSLKTAGREKEYLKFSSLEMAIYRIGGASATLCAGLALTIGYRKAYLIDALLGLICLLFSFRLKEIPALGLPETEKISARITECFQKSFHFLTHHLQAEKLMLWNGFAGALATLLVFFLQARLPQTGISMALIGPVLFLMGLGGAVGSRLALAFSGWSYKRISVLCACGIGIGLCCGITGIAPLMCLGGFMAPFFDDLLQVRSDVLLNEMIPSSQRATLISVSSLCFSLEMIFLSPLAGWFFGVIW